MTLSPADRQTLPEALVVMKAVQGDQLAYAHLVSQYQSWMRNLMRRLSGDPTMADDLAQQAFVTAWQKLHQVKNPQKFAGWLKKLAVNTWLQHARKNDVLSDSEDLSNWHPPAVELTHPGLQRDLDTALGELPNVVRLCVVLSYHEGMSHDEIAQNVAIPLGTVKSHIRRGTQRLQEYLAAYQSS